MSNDINEKYSKFYNGKNKGRKYPTEFVVRSFLASYPNHDKLKFKKHDKILDIGFGDGRNSMFLCDQGFEVYGTEITKEIVELTNKNMQEFGYNVNFKVGRNTNIPFKNNFFDFVLASHVCYYCDPGEIFEDNLKEISNKLKKNGFFIGSVVNSKTYLLKDSIILTDGTRKITHDPYNNREGYRMKSFENKTSVKKAFSKYFYDIRIGIANNNYFGIDEKVFWVICKKR